MSHPTAKERLDGLCKALCQDELQQLQTLLEGVTCEEKQEQVMWDFISKMYPMTLRNRNEEALRVYAAYRCETIEQLEAYLVQVDETLLLKRG